MSGGHGLSDPARDVLAKMAAGAVLRSGYRRAHRHISEAFWIETEAPDQLTVDRRVVRRLVRERLVSISGTPNRPAYTLTPAGRAEAAQGVKQ